MYLKNIRIAPRNDNFRNGALDAKTPCPVCGEYTWVVAKKLGVTRSRYTQIVNSKKPVSRNVALMAHRVFGASLEQMLSNPIVEGPKAS